MTQTLAFRARLRGYIDSQWDLDLGEFQDANGDPIDFSSRTFVGEIRSTADGDTVLVTPTITGTTTGHILMQAPNADNKTLDEGSAVFSIMETTAGSWELAGEGVIDLFKHATRSSGDFSAFTDIGGGLRAVSIDALGDTSFVLRGRDGITLSEVTTVYDNTIVARDEAEGHKDAAAISASDAATSANLMDERLLSLGDKFSETTASKNVVNGAVATSGTDYGLTFPIGVTGVSSFIQILWPFVGSGRVGDVVRLKFRLITSATFTRTLSMTFQVRINGTTSVNRTATITKEVLSGETVFTADYTLQGDETKLQPYISVTGTATTVEETMEVTELRPSNLSNADAVKTAEDVTTDLREAELLSEAIDKSALSLGDQKGLSGFTWSPQFFNGAVIDGVYGARVPAGQVGNVTLLQSKWDIDGAGQIGFRIKLRLGFTTSATFTRTIGNLVFQVQTSGGVVTRTSSATITTTLTATRRVYEIDYVLQGDETQLTSYIQITGGGVAATDETIELADFLPYYSDSTSDVKTTGDLALDQLRASIPGEVKSIGDVSYFFGFGNILSASVWVPQVFNGAVIVSPYTISIPTGQVGNVSLLQALWTPTTSAVAGREIMLKFAFDTSVAFTRTLANLVLQIQTSGGIVSRAADVTVESSGTRIIYTVLYTLQGDELTLQPYVQISGGGAALSDETITVTEFVPYYITGGNDVLTVMDEVLVERTSSNVTPMAERIIAYQGVAAAVPDKIKTIAPTGGDYTSPAAALADIGDASAINRYENRIAPGVYQDVEWFDKDYVDFIGESRKECIIDFQQANDTSSADIIQFSALYMRRTSRMEGLTVQAGNCRYAIHLESSKGGPNRVQDIINCHIEHLGNDDAVNDTWGSQNGIGSGLSSGQVVRIKNSTIISKNHTAFSYHTNTEFVAPTKVDLSNSTFLSHGDGAAIMIFPIGSFQADKCHINDCILGGDIHYSISPWLPITLAEQPANHAEIHISGAGNSPAVFRNTDWGESLRIDSDTTGTSSTITISGNAVADIFGDGANDRYFTVDGSPGFSGHVYGWGDVSGTAVGPSSDVFITTLGQRLGDCTSTNKTLNVTPDGGSAIAVTFDEDYTAQSNVDILADINTALGASATASIFKPGARYRPHISDEESSLKNGTGSGILMGSVLAFDNSKEAIRQMTSTDAATLFAGVAWEDIKDGERGRVKTRGWLPVDDILRTDSGSLTFADTFSVDVSNPGEVYVGGAQGLLSAIRSDAVEVSN